MKKVRKRKREIEVPCLFDVAYFTPVFPTLQLAIFGCLRKIKHAATAADDSNTTIAMLKPSGTHAVVE
jgi:hypothetical protein